MHIEEADYSADLADKMQELVRAYYACTPAHTGLPPYDFNWELYERLADAGMLRIFAAWDEHELVGFSMYIIMENMHHKGMLCAECDTLAVDHTRRGEGIGRQLVEYALRIHKAQGVKLVAHRYRTCYNTEPLFSALDFTCAEHVYVKEL